jgi:hypothetical protein
METAFILVVVAVSSAAGALLFRRGAQGRSFGAAIGKTLETVGLAALFLLLNVALGFSLALVARVVAGSFFSLYLNDDVTIVVLSVLQALVFQWWRQPDGRS